MASRRHGSPASGVGTARDCAFGPRQSIRETATGWTENEWIGVEIEFTSGPVGKLADRLAVKGLYTAVLKDMLEALKAYTESGTLPTQRVLLGSGRKL